MSCAAQERKYIGPSQTNARRSFRVPGWRKDAKHHPSVCHNLYVYCRSDGRASRCGRAGPLYKASGQHCPCGPTIDFEQSAGPVRKTFSLLASCSRFSDVAPFAYRLTTRIDEFEMNRRQIALRTFLGGKKANLRSAPVHAVRRAMGGSAVRPAPFGPSIALRKGEFWGSIFPTGLAAGALASVTRFVLLAFGRAQIGLRQKKAGVTSRHSAPAYASRLTTGCAGLSCAKR